MHSNGPNAFEMNRNDPPVLPRRVVPIHSRNIWAIWVHIYSHQGPPMPSGSPKRSIYGPNWSLSGPPEAWIGTWNWQIQVQVVSLNVFQWYLPSCHHIKAIRDHQGHLGPPKGPFMVQIGPFRTSRTPCMTFVKPKTRDYWCPIIPPSLRKYFVAIRWPCLLTPPSPL